MCSAIWTGIVSSPMWYAIWTGIVSSIVFVLFYEFLAKPLYARYRLRGYRGVYHVHNSAGVRQGQIGAPNTVVLRTSGWLNVHVRTAGIDNTSQGPVKWAGVLYFEPGRYLHAVGSYSYSPAGPRSITDAGSHRVHTISDDVLAVGIDAFHTSNAGVTFWVRPEE